MRRLAAATLLARAGLSVALVEQATFPRDTLSTHAFETAALARARTLQTTSMMIEAAGQRLGDLLAERSTVSTAWRSAPTDRRSRRGQ